LKGSYAVAAGRCCADDDFSRAGRVNNMAARRLTLLAEVRLFLICAEWFLYCDLD
jgi:hypothetical protein